MGTSLFRRLRHDIGAQTGLTATWSAKYARQVAPDVHLQGSHGDQGSRAGTATRTLKVTSGPAVGQSFEFDREIVIGREGDLAIPDAEMSRRHAAVRPVEG